MKTVLFIILLEGIFSFTVATFASTYKCLVLHHADGTQTAIGLYKEPRITFDAKSFIIHSPVLEMTFPKSEILRYTFEERGGDTAVETIREDRLEFQETSTLIIVKGLVDNAPVSLFDMSGRIIPVPVDYKGKEFQIPLSSIAKGVYVLSVGDQSFKFSKL